MKALIIKLILIICCSFYLNCFAQWSVIYQEGNNDPIVDITFTSIDTGFALTNSTLFRTIDGGYNWEQIYEATGFPLLHSISFGSKQFGYIVGEVPNSAIRTTDGGATWESISGMGGDLVNILDVYCVDDETCFAGKYFVLGGILATTNGFATFEYLNIECNNFNSIFFIDIDTGYACGWDCGGEIIKKTTNGGVTWTNVFYDDSDFGNKIFFPSNSTGFCIAGNGSRFFKTSDYGSTWQSVAYPYDFGWLVNLHFVTNDIGYVGAEKKMDIVAPIDSSFGSISRTFDSGLTWEEQSIDTTVGAILSIFCVDDLHCFAGTNDGKIITNIAIDTTTQINESIYIKSLSVYPNPASNYLKIGLTSKDNIESIITINLLGEKMPVYFNNESVADISFLPVGIYITEVILEIGKLSEMWIKR